PPEIKVRSFNYSYDADYSLKGYFVHSFFKQTIQKRGSEIIKAATEIKPDILHVHIHPRELNLGVLIQEQTKCQLVYSEHLVRLSPPSFSLNLLAKILRPVYHHYHLIAVSKSVYEELKKYRLVAKTKTLTLIENKLNLRLFPARTKTVHDVITVVYVARIGHPKGHSVLINAWSKLPGDIKKKLLLVGPDELNHEIHDLAQKLVPDGSVQFLGEQLDIRGILEDCDFAVLPSYKEGLPISLLEKMAMGLPVVASDIPELTSIIVDGVTGLIFKCGDSDDLATKLLVMMRDPALRLKLGGNARRTVEERFGSENIALANEKVYENVMNCR
ncbi:MAG: glycosyl transferase group 1, partial [Bacteroidetes bacterium]|nr:glycosyl transferase group 1 [Bacteroidota bacterium]